MTTMTVVGFASGSPLSLAAMTRIAREHRLSGIVMPQRRVGMLERALRLVGKSADPFIRLGVPLIDMRQVEQIRPDAIVVASFPQIIPDAALGAARIGAFNIHMSLLPRHRGVDPLFWTYWNDDMEAGVTTHWMTARVDAGDIAAQESLPLPRGLPSRELYMRLVALGVDQVARVFGQLTTGKVIRISQDEGRASCETNADIAMARIPFAHWPAERVWHVLSGLGDQRSGLIADATNEPLRHGRATGFHSDGCIRPGLIVLARQGYEVHCSDGVVTVERTE